MQSSCKGKASAEELGEAGVAATEGEERRGEVPGQAGLAHPAIWQLWQPARSFSDL